MAKLQDMPGYPDEMNIQEVMAADIPQNEIIDWTTDLLAMEAEPWLSAENPVDTDLALALVGAMRPIMESLTGISIMEAHAPLVMLTLRAYMNMVEILTQLENLAKKLELDKNA